jgi:hypothetical protein
MHLSQEREDAHRKLLSHEAHLRHKTNIRKANTRISDLYIAFLITHSQEQNWEKHASVLNMRLYVN